MRRARLLLLASVALPCASCGSDATAGDSPVPTASATEASAIDRIIVDTREPADFAAGHDAGAINLQWGWKQLQGRVRAYVPEYATALAVRAESPKRAEEAHALLVKAGYTDVVVLDGEPGTTTLSVMTAAELEERLAGDDPPVVIDVRTPLEWARGVIDGAIPVEQDAAPALVAELDPAKEYAIICAGGYRSGQLASLLRTRGFGRVHNVIDGMSAWYENH